jgi:hypothetical protein
MLHAACCLLRREQGVTGWAGLGCRALHALPVVLPAPRPPLLCSSTAWGASRQCATIPPSTGLSLLQHFESSDGKFKKKLAKGVGQPAGGMLGCSALIACVGSASR